MCLLWPVIITIGHIRVAGLQNILCVGMGCWQGHRSIIRLFYTTMGGSWWYVRLFHTFGGDFTADFSLHFGSSSVKEVFGTQWAVELTAACCAAFHCIPSDEITERRI